jgi:hypothetical protein
MGADMTSGLAKISKWIIVACLAIFTTFIIGCKKESKAMDINDVITYADKLTNMKPSSKEEAEKQLGVSLKHVDNSNELFSYYEFHGELPAFYGSTKAEFVIGNQNKESWLIAIDFILPICVDLKTIRNKYPGGEFILASPNNLSPDAANGYETRLNSGTLSFAFNVKSGCLTQMAFDKTEPVKEEPAKETSSLESSKMKNASVVSSPSTTASAVPQSGFAATALNNATKLKMEARDNTTQTINKTIVTVNDAAAAEELASLKELLKK